ncbi:hypothetical protein AB0G02_02580 [Actinosynnema sp. NPDC023658]|uniref:hypothetical protein n=1 Tax=Actinosynnema sp. NPDC023658 TaxID=3155465 RepID=UPI0033F97483
MTRVVVVALALALAALLAPSPFAQAQVPRAVATGHAVTTGSEEEPTRECRTAPEPRAWSPRSSSAGPVAGPTRRAPAARHRDVTEHDTPPVARGRQEHLRSWSTPSALQVFRN